MTTEDIFGNKYSDGWSKLLSVYQGQKTIKILSSVVEIFGSTEDNNAFYNCRCIEEVDFESPSKLQKIGAYAFYQCTKLNRINIFGCNDLTEICAHAFHNTFSLKSINFPPNLQKIYNDCFYSTGLETVTIPNKVTLIDNSAFMYSTNLTNVHFDSGIDLKNITFSSFARCNLQSFDVPPSVISFDSNALHANKQMRTITANGNSVYEVKNGILCTKDGLTIICCPALYTKGTVIVPNGVLTIATCCFHSCQADFIQISQSVKTIEQYAFRESLISSVSLPNSVEVCGPEAFYGCEKLTYATLSEKLETLDSRVFAYCTNLGAVNIPLSVKTFKGGAFAGCPKIDLRFVDGTPFIRNEEYGLVIGTLPESGDHCVCQYYGKATNAVVKVPSTVATLMENSFESFQNIRRIEFEAPSQLVEIKYCAFYNCTNLREIVFPPNLKIIGESSFECTDVCSIYLYSQITHIWSRAFHNCLSLTSVEFASSVTTNIVYGDNIFKGCSKINSVTLPTSTTSIGNGFLCDAISLKSITIPNSVVAIGEYAFSNTSIITVSFSSTINHQYPQLRVINNRAFYNTVALTTFDFPQVIATIGDYAFSNTSLIEIVIPDSIESIGEQCFSNCLHLTRATLTSTISSHLNSIGDGVFRGCLKLNEIICKNSNFVVANRGLYQSDMSKIYAFPPDCEIRFVSIPAQVKYISAGTFYHCTHIYNVLIPDGADLVAIGAESFSHCTNLRYINIPSKVEAVGVDAFYDCKLLECGLSIDNDDPIFRKSLVEIAKMPYHCLEKCVGCPTLNQELNLPIRGFLFFIMICQ